MSKLDLYLIGSGFDTSYIEFQPIRSVNEFLPKFKPSKDFSKNGMLLFSNFNSAIIHLEAGGREGLGGGYAVFDSNLIGLSWIYEHALKIMPFGLLNCDFDAFVSIPMKLKLAASLSPKMTTIELFRFKRRGSLMLVHDETPYFACLKQFSDASERDELFFRVLASDFSLELQEHDRQRFDYASEFWGNGLQFRANGSAYELKIEFTREKAAGELQCLLHNCKDVAPLYVGSELVFGEREISVPGNCVRLQAHYEKGYELYNVLQNLKDLSN